MRANLYLTLLWLSLCVPAHAASRPCSWWLHELGVWGILPDNVMQVTGRNSVGNRINPLGETFREVSFRITQANVAQVSQLLALEYPADVLERGLRTNLTNGHLDIPLTPFLPKRIQCKLGTGDSDPCYAAALNFHTPYVWNGSANDSIDFIRRNYSTIGYSDRLQFGDLLLFWSQATNPPFTFHVAIYLGGDIVYHKYGPTPLANYEYHTLNSLALYYSQAQLRSPEMKFFGQPFFVEMLRYDPEKRLPPAQSKPNG